MLPGTRGRVGSAARFGAMSTKARNEERDDGTGAVEAEAGASPASDAAETREPAAEDAAEAEAPEPPDDDDEVGAEAVVADAPAEVTAAGIEQVPPPNAFLKGAVLGLILLVPLTALAVYLLGRLEIGDPQASYYSIIAFAAVFAGLPAIITAGGIGRAAASALVRPGERGGPAASTRVATIDAALTGIGLVLLTVVPLGEVPIEVGTWVWIIVLGASTGALGGFVLGLWMSYGSNEP